MKLLRSNSSGGGSGAGCSKMHNAVGSITTTAHSTHTHTQHKYTYVSTRRWHHNRDQRCAKLVEVSVNVHASPSCGVSALWSDGASPLITITKHKPDQNKTHTHTHQSSQLDTQRAPKSGSKRSRRQTSGAQQLPMNLWLRCVGVELRYVTHTHTHTNTTKW